MIDRENAPTRTLQIIRIDKNSGAGSDDSEIGSDTDKEAGVGNGSGDSKESGTVDSGTVINYYYGIALIYEKEADKIHVYHFDHLGSTRNITDEKGNVCYRFKYGTFGELLSVWDGENTTLAELNKKHPVRFLYNGALGVAIDDNGLLYMRQRYYNTDIKRFINQDILEGNAISSQSLNRYAYVEGNPVNYNDPFGLSPRQILQPYVNLAHDVLSMASIIPGPVGAIAAICDIGLSYATGDFSALGKSILSAIITGGFKTYINNACKISKALKYIAGAVFAGYGLNMIYKSYTLIRDSALQLVDLMFSGGSPLEYSHALCNLFQGMVGLAGGVGFSLGAAVGMTRQCFVAGTKVKTEDGDKNIEEIEAGDLVWSYDPVTGEEGLKEVKQTFENETETLVHVTVSNENVKETIDTTVRHPFYVVGYGFRFASELRVGDKLLTVSGDIYEVTSVEIEDLDEPVKIYNFEVEDWHTYFVSESGILVHNMCAKKSGAEIKKGTKKKKNGKPDSTRAIEGGSESNYILYNKTHKDSLPKPKGTGPNGGRLQSHHGLQQEWCKENLSQYGYDASLAPTVTIESGKGMPHTFITNAQNARRDARVAAGQGKWSSSLQEELSYIVSDFRKAGFSDNTINSVLEQQYNMLDKLGVSYERIKY